MQFHEEIFDLFDFTSFFAWTFLNFLAFCELVGWHHYFNFRFLFQGSLDCGMQILKNEGFMSMMKGAGANVLRGVAGAGVLAGFDKFKEIYIAWRLANA